MVLLVGIDIGTSGTKTIVTDEGGRCLSQAYRAYQVERPRPEWAEQHPDTWWRAVCETTRKALAEAKCDPAEIAAVGLSGQMHGLVMLHSDRSPAGNAIIWPDARSAAEVRDVWERFGPQRLCAMTCNGLFTGFMAASILWMMQNQPDCWGNVRHVLLPKDYIRLRMTGLLASEPSDACATLLFDTANGRWNTELCGELGIDESLLPPIIDSCAVAGKLNGVAAAELGLPAGLPVAAGGGDLAMDALGTGIVEPGMACSNIGTGGQFFVVTNLPMCDSQLRIHTWCHAMPERWISTGVALSAGMSLDWFSRKVAGYAGYDEASKQAETVEAGSCGLLFLPHLVGARTPVRDTNSGGMFVGLNPNHGRAEMARAVMEGVAFALRESMEVIIELGIPFDSVIVSGGGARSRVWRQIQADVFNRPVRVSTADEQAALGAALCAGVAAGVYPDIPTACRSAVHISDDVVHPIVRNAERYDKLFGIYRRLHADNRETFRLLASLRCDRP